MIFQLEKIHAVTDRDDRNTTNQYNDFYGQMQRNPQLSSIIPP